jgi:hypothetical protein
MRKAVTGMNQTVKNNLPEIRIITHIFVSEAPNEYKEQYRYINEKLNPVAEAFSALKAYCSARADSLTGSMQEQLFIRYDYNTGMWECPALDT